MKALKYFFPVVLVMMVSTMMSCYTDDTNTDYLSEEEAGKIVIDTVGLGNKWMNYYKLSPGQHVDYDVNVKYVHPERLRYRWFVLKTNYNQYQAEQVGNVLKYPAADTIAHTKALKWDVDVNPGTYFIYLMAEDSITGMKAYFNPSPSYISVNQDGYVGGLYLLTEREGQTDIEVYQSPLMLIYGDSCYYDYYHKLAGHYLEGKPLWIRGCTTGKTTKDGYLVGTDANLYRINSVNMTTMNEWNTSFYDTPDTRDPQCAFYTNSCEFLINNGKLHVMYANKANDRKFSAPIAGDYEAGAFLMFNTRTTWRPVTGAINAWQVIYDKRNRRFRPYYSQASQISSFKNTSDTAYVDANNLPVQPSAIFNSGGNYTCCVMHIDGKPYLYRYNFYNRVDKGDLSAAGKRSIIDLSGCTDIMDAKLFASNTSGYAFYYATDKAVYSFSASSGQTTSNTIYTCEAGEKVTAIYAWGSAGGGWPTSDVCFWIGVWNENTNQGKLIQYEMDVNYGLPNSYWGPMFGAPDNPVVTTGWGKIVGMTCVDAE